MNRRIHTACLGIIFDVLCASLTVAQTTPVAGVQEKAIPLQSVSAIAVSPDGAHLAVSRYSPNGNETRTDIDNDSVEVWSLHSALAPQVFATNLHPIRNLAFSHNSQLLSAASQGFETILDEPPAAPQIFVGKVYLWHVADASEVKLSRPKIFWFYGNEGTYDEWSCTSVAFSPDDKQVVADIFEVSRQPEYDVGTTFFDIKTGRAVNSTSLDTENSASPYWRRFSWLSPDGRRAFVLRRNRPVLVDTLNGRRVSGFAEFPLYFNPSDQDACDLGVHAFGLAAFQPDMRRVALANDSQLEIRDAMTGAIKTQTALKQTNNASRSLAAVFEPNGSALALSRCGLSNEVRLYEASALQLRATSLVDSVQSSLQFSPDGLLLFTAGMDGYIHVWETEKLSLLATLLRSPSGEWIIFTPDGLYDASSAGAALLVWHLDGRSISASDLASMRMPGLLSILAAGKRPKPDSPLSLVISKALSHNHD